MRKAAYILIPVLFALLLGGLYYYISLAKSSSAEQGFAHEPTASSALLEVEEDDSSADEEGYDVYPDELPDELATDENIAAYSRYRLEMEKYNATLALDFLWDTAPAQTSDSVARAISYFVESGMFSQLTVHNGYALPGYIHYATYASEDGEPSQSPILIPTAIRTYIPYSSAEQGACAYKLLVELLSKGRSVIDYYALYSRYKHLIRQLVSQELFSSQYAASLQRLVAAYRDFESSKDLYDKVEYIMNVQWSEHVADIQMLEPGCVTSTWHSSYIPYFEEAIPQASLSMFTSNSGELNESELVWAYSFWLRRKADGNTEVVLKTLQSVLADYGYAPASS